MRLFPVVMSVVPRVWMRHAFLLLALSIASTVLPVWSEETVNSQPATPAPAETSVNPTSTQSNSLPSDSKTGVPPSKGALVFNPGKASKASKKGLTPLSLPTPAEGDNLLPLIINLKWQPEPLHESQGNVRKVDLTKVFQETANRSFKVKEAAEQLHETETQAKELIESNPLLLLNPIATNLLKQAGQANIKASQANLEAVRQQALLESASIYNKLVQSYLTKYLAFQAIQQGKTQLQLQEQRFKNGETEHFDVIQTKMALLARYNQYEMADDAYYSTSLALTGHLNLSEPEVLVPAEVSLNPNVENGEHLGMVQLLNLIPNDLTLNKAKKMVQNRPDLMTLQLKEEALQKMVKASTGQDKKKKEADLRDLALAKEKASRLAVSALHRDFAHYASSQKTLQVAQQQTLLAQQLVHQLEVSNKAGFASAKDVLEGQMQLTKATSELIEASLNVNLAQIQLLQDMGQLSETLNVPQANTL